MPGSASTAPWANINTSSSSSSVDRPFLSGASSIGTQQILRRRGPPFLRLVVRMKHPEAVGAGELPRECAPWLAEHAPVAGRVADLDAFLHVELVEGQHRHARSAAAAHRCGL